MESQSAVVNVILFAKPVTKRNANLRGIQPLERTNRQFDDSGSARSTSLNFAGECDSFGTPVAFDVGFDVGLACD